MRFYITTFVLFILVFQTCLSQDTKRFKKHISYLTSKKLEGRAVNSNGIDLATMYILESFSQNKRLEISIQEFDFFHNNEKMKGKNIIAFKNNKSDSTIIISAHYDHIGYGGELSKSIGTNGIHFGADDNASGVSLLLELANYFSKVKFKYNIYFVALTAHEIGLYGSEYFSKNLTEKNKIKAFINFDMIGRLDENHKLYYEATSTLDMCIKNQIEKVSYLNLYKSYNNRLEILDTKHFVKDNIPCITFTTGMHSDYHKVSDEEQYINYDGLLLIEKFIIKYIHSIY